MQNPRKKIILNEILFWKQNKLLPEQYCDFLMTLYSEGNEIESEEEISHKNAIKAKEKRNNMLFITLLSLVVVVLILLLFLMTEAVWIMAIITGVVACALMVGAFMIAKKNGLLAPILQVLSALLIFGLSVKVSLTYFADNLIVLYSLLIANCFNFATINTNCRLPILFLSELAIVNCQLSKLCVQLKSKV